MKKFIVESFENTLNEILGDDFGIDDLGALFFRNGKEVTHVFAPKAWGKLTIINEKQNCSLKPASKIVEF